MIECAHDPNADSSGDEYGRKPAKTSTVTTRTAIEAEYIPDDVPGDDSEEDLPMETEKERKKRIKKEKKEARRAAKEATATTTPPEGDDDGPVVPDTQGESKTSSKKSKKKEKKLTRKQKKQLELEQSMKEMDKQIAVSSKFPFTVSHCVHAIADKVAWKRSKDINIEEFTIAGSGAKGTQLFENAQLKIVEGRKVKR